MNNADKQERPPPYFDPHRRQGDQQQYQPQQSNQGTPNPSFGGYAQAGFVPREQQPHYQQPQPFMPFNNNSGYDEQNQHFYQPFQPYPHQAHPQGPIFVPNRGAQMSAPLPFYQTPPHQQQQQYQQPYQQTDSAEPSLSNLFSQMSVGVDGALDTNADDLTMIKNMMLSNMKDQERQVNQGPTMTSYAGNTASGNNGDPQELTEYMSVTIFPCGNEDGSHVTSPNEHDRPYEIKIMKKMNENSLKDIFARQKQLWEPVFRNYMLNEETPNFSVYRKPYIMHQGPYQQEQTDQLLHILYMKSNAKSLSRNYTAAELELYCQNRFYGPLIVAFNLSRPPYYLDGFSLSNLQLIQSMNQSFHAKNTKDDFVLDCLLEAAPLKEKLNQIYKNLEAFTFYMFRYKSCWCPNKKDSHDSKSCIYAHHMRDFRRPPEIFKYVPEDCEYMQSQTNGTESGWEQCPQGLLCNKCHTTVERLYHPDKYKRIYCDRSRCNKSEICAFYHSQQERNHAQKVCKNYRKQVQNKKYDIKIKEINKAIKEYYQNPAPTPSNEKLQVPAPVTTKAAPALSKTKLDVNTTPFVTAPSTIKYAKNWQIQEDYIPDPSTDSAKTVSNNPPGSGLTESVIVQSQNKNMLVDGAKEKTPKVPEEAKQLSKKSKSGFSSSGESQDEVQMEMVDAEQVEQLIGQFKGQNDILSFGNDKGKGRPGADKRSSMKVKSVSTSLRGSWAFGLGQQPTQEESESGPGVLGLGAGQQRRGQSVRLERRPLNQGVVNQQNGEKVDGSSMSSSILSANNPGNMGSFEANFMSSLNFQARNQMHLGDSNLSQLLVEQQVVNQFLKDQNLSQEQREYFRLQQIQRQQQIDQQMRQQQLQHQQLLQQQQLYSQTNSQIQQPMQHPLQQQMYDQNRQQYQQSMQSLASQQQFQLNQGQNQHLDQYQPYQQVPNHIQGGHVPLTVQTHNVQQPMPQPQQRLTAQQYVQAFGDGTGLPASQGKDSYYSQLLFQSPSDSQSPGLPQHSQAGKSMTDQGSQRDKSFATAEPLGSDVHSSKNLSSSNRNQLEQCQALWQNAPASEQQNPNQASANLDANRNRGIFALQAVDSDLNNLGNFDFLDDEPFAQDVKAIRKASKTFHAPASRRSYHINDDFGEQQMKHILESSEDDSKKDPQGATAADKADLKNIAQD